MADAIPTNGKVPSSGTESSVEDNSMASAASTTNGDNNITVFHDPENFNVKHPLMHEWTLWFTKPPSGKVRSLTPSLKRC